MSVGGLRGHLRHIGWHTSVSLSTHVATTSCTHVPLVWMNNGFNVMRLGSLKNAVLIFCTPLCKPQNKRWKAKICYKHIIQFVFSFTPIACRFSFSLLYFLFVHYFFFQISIFFSQSSLHLAITDNQQISSILSFDSRMTCNGIFVSRLNYGWKWDFKLLESKVCWKNDQSYYCYFITW